MKKLIALAALTLSTVTSANPYDYKIIKVSDGDTVVFEAPFMPAPLKPQLSLRVLGVDTPEKGARAACPAEAAAALETMTEGVKLNCTNGSASDEVKKDIRKGVRKGEVKRTR